MNLLLHQQGHLLKIYNNPNWQPEPTSKYDFEIGNYVYAIQTGNTFYTRAIITNINNGIYTIQFDNKFIQETANINEFLIYFPCNCDNTKINEDNYSNESLLNTLNCGNTLTNEEVL